MLFKKDLSPDLTPAGRFDIRFPDDLDKTPSQDEEWCEVKVEEEDWQRLRFHNYGELYNVTGLYETLFYRRLRCCSPKKVVSLLEQIVTEEDEKPEELRVLDLGAGNGMVGGELLDIGVRHVTGIDIIPEAMQAARRDRAWAYNDYLVEDMTKPGEVKLNRMRNSKFNALTCVAALGFGDVPTLAFTNATELVSTNGWLAFNIKEDFLFEDDSSGFCETISRLKRDRVIRIECMRRYCHRLSVTEEPLYYVAVVARKLRELPADLVSIR